MRRLGAWWMAGALMVAAPAGAADETGKDSGTKVSAGQDGFVIQSEDGSFRLRVSGYAQVDGRFYAEDEDRVGTDAFLLRRIRPIVSGTVGKIFDFTIMPDFGVGAAVIQDAYLEARFSEKARLRVGKFKVPFGLERLQSATNILFIERGFPSVLAPIRDVGIQVQGDLGGGVASYAVGVFNGAPDGGSVDTDVNDGKDVAGRVFLQPFKRSKAKGAQGIGIGFAATTGTQEGSLPSFRSPGQLPIFSYPSGVTAAGKRTRLTPQASYAHGPFRLIGEYVRSSQDTKRADETIHVVHDAWQAAAAFVLTGETAPFSGVSPKHPFEKGKGWGAVEVAARYTELDLDDGLFNRGLADAARTVTGAQAFAIGVNWYLTKNIKYVVNYERTNFDGGSAAGDRKPENALLFRAQVAF